MDGINLYNKAYADALAINNQETERWKSYRKEHEETKQNLRMYQKELNVDILIPIGSKALLPGKLYHTGEVMASHGCGYFSDCSVEQANVIIDHRIRIADEMLQRYDTERDLFTNNMQIPFAEDAFPGQEIIEEYNEEEELRWREEHRKRTRKYKQREAKEQLEGRGSSSDQDIFDRLEELELMEELEQEIDKLDVPIENDDQLRQLMSGAMKFDEKQRLAHDKSGKMDNESTLQTSEVQTEVHSKVDIEPVEIDTTDDDASSASEDSDNEVSAEFVKLLQDTKSMNKKDKIEAFRKKIHEVNTRLKQSHITVEEKVDLCDLRYEVEEALDFMCPSWETSADTPESKTNEKRKRIQFADTDSVKFINDQEAVSVKSELPQKGSAHTLELKVTHSAELCDDALNGTSGDKIQSPVDIYRLFEHCMSQEKNISPVVETKSILKNREMVFAETHCTEIQSTPHQSRPKKAAVPVDIIGDVIEHSIEVLPEQGAAQKKVSRFKQQRRV